MRPTGVSPTTASSVGTVALAVTATVLTLVLGAGAAVARGAWEPPPDTVTRVTGTSQNGFHVEHYDGSTDYLPTLSEAVAECSEYPRTVRQVRCTVRVRTWYHDLGDLKRALRYARLR